MPTISMFFGITVRMYYDEHPPPHFHAYYGECDAKIDIETLRVIKGFLPRRALALTIEWANQHRDELLSNWLLVEEHKPLETIPPLE